jgi:anti-repressor protein
MCEYGFTEELDYTPYIFVHPKNQQETTDYQISIEMAKEISMLQRTEKGKQARQYFIQLEKAWNSPEAVMARALNMANKTIENLKSQTYLLENKVEEQKQIITEQIPKVELADRLFICDGEKNIGEVAKLFNERLTKNKSIGRTRLFEILRNLEVLMVYGAEKNNPRQKYIDSGYFVLKTSTFDNGYGKTKLSSTTKVTPKGIQWLWKFLIKKGYIIIDDIVE